jgi:opacity protein-like surface antigen
MKKNLLISCLGALGCLIGTAAAPAAQWNHTFTAYLLGASMDGTTAIGPVEVDVDLSFSDIMDKLEFGAMAHYRGERDKLSLGLDVIYMGLGSDRPGIAETDVDQWMVEGTAGWRLTDAIEVFGGVRYNDVAARIDLFGPQLASFSKSEGWFDPIVGARLWLPLAGSFSGILRGDIGGFGVGSDLTWQLGAHLRYAFSNSFSALVGYRYLVVDYETGEGQSRFVYDMTIQGPTLGLSWTF